MTEPTLNSGPIMAEFRKPDGDLVFLRKDSASTYLKKGFVLTGKELSMDEWNQYAVSIDRYKAIGDDQSAKSPPLFPGPLVGSAAGPVLVQGVGTSPNEPLFRR